MEFTINMQSFSVLISSAFVLFFNFFTYFKNKKSKVNLWFAFFGISIFIWLFSFAVSYSVNNLELKLYLFKVGYIGIIFIPINFYSFIHYLLEKRGKVILFLNYIIGTVFVVLNFSGFPLVSGLYKYSWGYYPKVSLALHPIFLIFFVSLFTFSVVRLLIAFLDKSKFSTLRRIRIKYIFLGSIFGVMGSIDNFASYKVDIFPFGFIFMLIYPLVLTYAIVRYRLMDISIAITRSSVFIATYSLILGIPFIIASTSKSWLIGLFGVDKWWLGPMGLMTILATVGPFIYIFINKKAEERLLKEQRQYQNTLRQASSGMIRVRELKRLLNLIVHVVTRAVKLEFASIYLFDSDNRLYKMAARRDSSKLFGEHTIGIDTPLIDKLHLFRDPLVYEEVQLQSQDNPRDAKMRSLEQQLREIQAAVVIPSYVGNKMLGFIILGKKKTGKLFSQDDLNVFSVLANQAALAIENAQFYEDIKETQEQLFQAEKMATIGTMADGLSHQINNRFQALSLISGDSLDIVKTTDITACPDEVKEAFGQLKYAFERVQSNVKQGGEIVRGLLKYSRPGETGFEFVDFNRVIDGALEMAQYKVRLNELNIQRNIPEDLPKIKCNLTQLEEIFFNMVDNAYDAIKERQALNKDLDIKGNIKISVKIEDGHMRIIFQDNGIGVKDKDKEKLFTPFFTTKGTNKKGTGLGLYVIQKIVSFHNGTISIDSTYNKGTTFDILLPLTQK